MPNLKKYGEIKGVNGQSKFYGLCGALTLSEAESWDIEDLSTKLNQYYPKEAMHDSPLKNQWKSARSNLDRILDNQKPSLRRWVFTHPLMTTILGTVIGGIILVVINDLPKYIGENSEQNIQPEKSKDIDKPETITTPSTNKLINT
ncbi:hypothetical protein [Sessilibacter corallicola]|uniref:Uncharacterized protein n=1 Tax=Sessilibacter corallicola TaxID=2904075 RepID=A0ABQ0ACM0_9GAMM